MKNKEMRINLFWFKRDLRLEDNEALLAAIQNGLPLLLIYILEPSLMQDPHYSARHFQFIEESLIDLNDTLKSHHLKLEIVQSEVLPFVSNLCNQIQIETLYSTEETGLNSTYQRDLALAEFCKEHNIYWREFQNNGVQRGINTRKNWSKDWYTYMSAPIQPIDLEKIIPVDAEVLTDFLRPYTYKNISERIGDMQIGGRKEGKKWENSFFNERLAYYQEYISKPEMSRYGCSRLSPYFAWGCISIREIYQRAIALKKDSPYKKQLSAFCSRLRWQSHFIQKFETEPRYEFEAINRGYLDMDQPYLAEYEKAWKTGRTGYPLVDACIHAVLETGYLNFRMRTMITSFLLHHLFQHFTVGSAWLAQQFLDFEPGIHYAQMQMQAGFTATNTVRIYNPTKNALDHDPEAVFIKKWMPALRHLPDRLAIEPWKITAIEEELYQFKIGKEYPERIIDMKRTRPHALKMIYGKRKDPLVQQEKQRILKVHTMQRSS